MAVCEGCGSAECCLHRRKVVKKMMKLAQLLTELETLSGPVELDDMFISANHVIIRYSGNTREWTLKP